MAGAASPICAIFCPYLLLLCWQTWNQTLGAVLTRIRHWMLYWSGIRHWVLVFTWDQTLGALLTQDQTLGVVLSQDQTLGAGIEGAGIGYSGLCSPSLVQSLPWSSLLWPHTFHSRQLSQHFRIPLGTGGLLLFPQDHPDHG